MNKVILITGSSSGIGRAAVRYFSGRGWQVAASMRDIKSTNIPKLPNVRLYQLDVTDLRSIKDTVLNTIKDFKRIDCLLNNAGYGLLGPFEEATEDQIERQIKTNLTGLIHVTKQVIPIMRHQKSGVIVNISSVAGRIGFPFYSYYNATKFAVEGLSESLSYELAPFGISVKIIEPGPTNTNFFESSADYIRTKSNYPYTEYYKQNVRMMKSNNQLFLSNPTDAARVIWNAVHNNSVKLRYPTGKIAPLMMLFRTLIPDIIFQFIMKKRYNLLYGS